MPKRSLRVIFWGVVSRESKAWWSPCRDESAVCGPVVGEGCGASGAPALAFCV